MTTNLKRTKAEEKGRRSYFRGCVSTKWTKRTPWLPRHTTCFFLKKKKGKNDPNDSIIMNRSHLEGGI